MLLIKCQKNQSLDVCSNLLTIHDILTCTRSRYKEDNFHDDILQDTPLHRQKDLITFVFQSHLCMNKQNSQTRYTTIKMVKILWNKQVRLYDVQVFPMLWSLIKIKRIKTMKRVFICFFCFWQCLRSTSTKGARSQKPLKKS